MRNTVNKGYLKGVPGAPMCGCVEHMPVVEEATCRTATKTGDVTSKFIYDSKEEIVYASNNVGIEYEDCDEPDLKSQYIANQDGNRQKEELIDAHIVGLRGCKDDVVDYLNNEQFLHQGQHSTKYLTPDSNKWSDLIVGEGVYFQPPAINSEKANTAFRNLVNGRDGFRSVPRGSVDCPSRPMLTM